MIRTSEEIEQRIKDSSDFMSIQQVDLIAALDGDTAKKYFSEEYLKKVEAGEDKWEPQDPKQMILEYLPFAYDKAENQRGLSAGRSMLHFKSWIWLEDDEFYKSIIDDIDNYTNYGIPTLDKIAEHYGFDRVGAPSLGCGFRYFNSKD